MFGLKTDRIPRWHLVSVLGVAMVAALLFAPAPPKRFRAEYDPQSYPARAIEALKRMPEPRIFTNDQWGDYLIWRLYPSDKVFVDGRSDFYGSAFEEKCIDVLNVKYDWERILSGFHGLAKRPRAKRHPSPTRAADQAVIARSRKHTHVIKRSQRKQ